MTGRAIILCVLICLFGTWTAACGAPPSGSLTSAEAPTVGTSVVSTSARNTLPVSTSATISTTTSLLPTTTQPSPGEQILEHMNLLQKAAQVLLLTIDGTALSPSTQALLAEGPPGGILLLERNVTGATQVRALTMALQRGAALVGSGVELFVAVDQEGGLVQRIHEGVPAVPAARSLGDESTPAVAAGLATKTAGGLVALGVNMNLAPVADVVDDRKSFLYQRTYGGDATLVAAFVTAVTEAFTRGGLISVVKHFPGHGSASGDTHDERAISNATKADFETVHLPPFRAAIEAGAEGVMMAHLIATAYDPERPASQSGVVIGGLLRGDLGFDGLVVADDLEMAAAGAAGPGEAAVAALEAGCDLLISSGTAAGQREVMEAIVNAVETGRLAPSRLDQAVLRVLALKLRHGIIASQP
jgi:beta-N-acetylhexosaminidase